MVTQPTTLGEKKLTQTADKHVSLFKAREIIRVRGRIIYDREGPSRMEPYFMRGKG